MNKNNGWLIRNILIIRKLSGKTKYVSVDDLISCLNLQMEFRKYGVNLSPRTLQYDIAEIKSISN